MPVAVRLEKVLIGASNGTYSDKDLSGEIQMYSKDLDTTHPSHTVANVTRTHMDIQ